MKRFAFTTTAACALAITGCQNSGSSHAQSTYRPEMEATMVADTTYTYPYVATVQTRYAAAPTYNSPGGTLLPGDVVYFDNRSATTDGWRMAHTTDGRTLFVHPYDFRPRP